MWVGTTDDGEPMFRAWCQEHLIQRSREIYEAKERGEENLLIILRTFPEPLWADLGRRILKGTSAPGSGTRDLPDGSVLAWEIMEDGTAACIRQDWSGSDAVTIDFKIDLL